ncbi:substrate-binding domain-containing protein [Phycicoccus sp. BSK3Z-2]|uniref:Substrate-binding domain-containing protein n=1 Tax=Phycicoccus avicenniae TaxID=2828860 RepID=A0A941DB81_9MICO|nr:substrate-binding domain-containing protein [Phycicoccus avicenniae]MBR7744926.1 substrate-binding domain-containing protein [Phycicoccus avicenniae]
MSTEGEEAPVPRREELTMDVRRVRERASGRRRPAHRSVGVAVGTGVALVLAACGGPGGGTIDPGSDEVSVTLVTQDGSSPFFRAMEQAARDGAGRLGVALTVDPGEGPTDVEGQVRSVEEAVLRGDDGILITPVSGQVEDAITAAREAGVYVVALDNPTSSATRGADITFATDNRQAGTLLGQWVAARLGGDVARVAMLDLVGDDSVSVDVARHDGFLAGMAVPVGDPRRTGDEARSGTYGEDEGTYSIVCSRPSLGTAEGGADAMRACLEQEGPTPTVVYAAADPAALGAREVLTEVGLDDVLVVSVDGGCEAVDAVEDGRLSATAQQYPVRMVDLGLRAVVEVVSGGERPRTSDGLDFHDTGVALVTDDPVADVTSLDSEAARGVCWG